MGPFPRRFRRGASSPAVGVSAGAGRLGPCPCRRAPAVVWPFGRRSLGTPGIGRAQPAHPTTPGKRAGRGYAVVRPGPDRDHPAAAHPECAHPSPGEPRAASRDPVRSEPSLAGGREVCNGPGCWAQDPEHRPPAVGVPSGPRDTPPWARRFLFPFCLPAVLPPAAVFWPLTHSHAPCSGQHAGGLTCPVEDRGAGCVSADVFVPPGPLSTLVS